MKFITRLFKPRNEINDLFERSRKKRDKENAKKMKETTAYINNITKRVMWKRKKDKLATVPVIKFLLKIVKFFTPVRKEGPFSVGADFKPSFTSDEINSIYARVLKNRKDEEMGRQKYIRNIEKRVGKSKNKKD